MSGLKKERRARRPHEDEQSGIGLEPQSLTDVTSHPYPATIRALDKSQDGLSELSDAAQSKEQVEDREDEGGNVLQQGDINQ